MDIWVVSSFFFLVIMLLWIFLYLTPGGIHVQEILKGIPQEQIAEL